MLEDSLSTRNKPEPPFRDIVGIILAGGKSARYGRNKALENIGGKALIEHVVDTVRPLFQDIIVITNTPSEYSHLGLEMHQDIIKGLGPIGGIYTALKVIKEDYGFVVACDMPFLNKALITYMVSLKKGFDVVVPRMGWKIEALHAIYNRGCIEQIEKNIQGKIYQVMRVFDSVNVRYVDEEEIKKFDPDLKSFLNINRPHDLRRLETLWLNS
ncbi:MAG: molybdenum cofactor guanylyltransferase [Deltaproteobacteria bacterium]|nr:MAG: molybdenum cofactor guanylyltransferase [Deltaproteobacteria bacterium]